MEEKKRSRSVLTTAALVLLTVALIAAAFWLGSAWHTEELFSRPTLTEIQRLGDLVVLRVNVADVVEASSDDFKGAWIARGDALVAVDMQLAELESVDDEARVVVVRLPQPRVIQPRVDHRRSKTYDVSKRDWWNPFVGDSDEFADQGMRKAQDVVERAAAEADVMEQARDQAELILDNMYRLVGWKIDVAWND